jgi:hypothetical protein
MLHSVNIPHQYGFYRMIWDMWTARPPLLVDSATTPSLYLALRDGEPCSFAAGREFEGSAVIEVESQH